MPSAIAKNRTRERKQLTQLEKSVPREEFLAFLLRQSDPRFHEVAQHMVAPGTRVSLATLCLQIGLKYYDLTDAYIKDKQTEGLVRSSQHLPDVMEDIAVDSRSREDICTDCDGSGEYKNKLCKACGGKGKIRVMGDGKSRDQLLRAHDLIKPDKGVTVDARTANFTVPSLASLVGAAQKALLPPVVNVEVKE